MLNKFLIILIPLLIFAGAWHMYFGDRQVTFREFFLPSTPIVHFGDLPVRVEVVASPEALTQGLSGREDIWNQNEGMFFIFPNTDKHGIWMKDMKFSIDIVWIDETLTVIGIERNVSPDTYPRVFRPEKPVRYVLETKDRYVDLVGIHVGQKVRIPLE